VLKELELERQRDGVEAELLAAEGEDRRSPDVRRDQAVRRSDRFAVYRTVPRAATGQVTSTLPPRTP
jgi:hypothetical protein